MDKIADLRQRRGARRLKSNLNLLLMREYAFIKLLLSRLSWILGYLSWVLRQTCRPDKVHSRNGIWLTYGSHLLIVMTT